MKAPTLTVVAKNLANPRKLVVGSNGTVYVAEAGSGGRDRFSSPEARRRASG
jgi:hypothetical protein